MESNLLRLICLWILFGAHTVASGAVDVVDVESGFSESPNDPLREWMNALKIPVPQGIEGDMPMGMGVFETRGGHCEGLTLDKVELKDLSSGPVLELALEVSGLGISCYVDGYSDGPISINITLAQTALSATVQILPLISDFHPDLPLPMGGFNMTSCLADIQVADMTSAGSGFLAETLAMLGESVIPLVGMAVNDPLCEGMKTFLEGEATVTTRILADFAQAFMNPPMPVAEPTILKKALDWARYPPVQVVQALLHERFPLFAGRLIQIVDTNEIYHTLASSDTFGVTLVDMNIEGRGEHHVPTVELLAQSSTLGVAANLSSMIFSSIIDLGLTLPGQPNFSHRVNVTLGLEDFSIGVRAVVDKDVLDNLEVDQAMKSPACLMQCTEGTTDPHRDSVDFESFHIDLRPLFMLQSVGAVESVSEILDVINTVVAAVYRVYLPTVNVLINGLLGTIRSVLDEQLWKFIDAAPPCTREDMYSMMSEASIQGLWSTAVVLALIGLPIGMVVHMIHKKRAGARQSQNAQEDSEQVQAPALPLGPLPLCRESCVPVALAVYYPFAVIAAMFLFAYADLEVGATVTMVMEADGEASSIGPLFAFSLVSTVMHCWNSQAYFIAVLTVIASGIWPFVKLSCLLIAWMVPPRERVKVRGRVLDALDSWGKYSFLDSWFLVITLSAFAIEWDGAGNVSMKIQTNPEPAFYAFFAATVFSLVLGHVASEVHQTAEVKRKAVVDQKVTEVTPNQREIQKSAEDAAPLCNFVEKPNMRLSVAVAMGVSLLLSFMGIFLIAFSFKVGGVLPQFLFGHETEHSYSLFSVGVATARGRSNEFLLLVLEMSFLLLAIAVPLVLLVCLLVLWLVPFNIHAQKRLLHSCRMLDAWACLDVAVLVLVIACFEFEKLVEFLVYEGNFAAACNAVKDLAKDECLNIELIGHPGLVLLFFTGAVMLFVPKICVQLCQNAIQMRERLPTLNKMDDDKKHNVCSHEEAVVESAC